jgi:hypothetical protein
MHFLFRPRLRHQSEVPCSRIEFIPIYDMMRL